MLQKYRKAADWDAVEDEPNLQLTVNVCNSEAIIVPHRIIWSWCTGRWWVGCYIWYGEEGTGRGPSLPRPLLAAPNVLAHLSTASVPITVLLCNDLFPCDFNVSLKDWCCIAVHQHQYFMSCLVYRLVSYGKVKVWYRYGIVGFNVPLDTL